MDLTEEDIQFFRRAIEPANEAGQKGNLPIGALIAHEGNIVAEGKNAVWIPTRTPGRHAEMEALRGVPADLWDHAPSLTLYTTLEPCLMCTGAILLHKIGRVLYGSSDSYGGAGPVFGHLPLYFGEQAAKTEWIGPAYPAQCDRLFERVMALVRQRRGKPDALRRDK